MRIGLQTGGRVTLEERPGELILRPASTLEVEIFAGADLAKWDAEDRIDERTRKRIRKRVLSRR